jgi:hypothetical protein
MVPMPVTVRPEAMPFKVMFCTGLISPMKSVL